MDTLLSEKDFRGEINVHGTEQTVICEELCRWIVRYEYFFMENVLGYDLSKAFYDGAALESPDQRWIDLLNGVVWVKDGRNVNWPGLKYCAARYVYFYYIRHCAKQAKGDDAKVPQAGGVTVEEAYQMCIEAWNQMSRALLGLWDMLRYYKESDAAVFPEYNDGRGLERWMFRPINAQGI